MRLMARWMAAAGLLLALVPVSHGASYTSRANGNYNAAGTWNEGGNPGGATVADTVTVNTPHTVTVTAARDASNDVVTVNSGGKLTTPTGSGAVNDLLAWSQIELNGGALACDIQVWNGLQTDSKVIARANSTFNSFDSYSTYKNLGYESATYGSLAIDPSVTKVIFTNSSPAQGMRRTTFSGAFTLSSSVEMAVDATNAQLNLYSLGIQAGQTLTKTGPGWMGVGGTGTSAIGSTVVVARGTFTVGIETPKNKKYLQGLSTIEVHSNATLFVDYVTGNPAFSGVSIFLKGGGINWRYTDWAQDTKGCVTVKSNSTMNVSNADAAIHGTAITYDTLAFDAAPSGDGYELRCTHDGSHANWTNTVLYSAFQQSCAISNDAVINADRCAGADFQSTLTIAAGKTLRKKGQGKLRFGGTVNSSTASLAIEAGEVTNATSNLSFDTLTFKIAGTTLGTDYGQLNVTTRNLTNTRLAVLPAPGAVKNGQKFVLVTRVSPSSISLKDIAGAAIAEGGRFASSDGSKWNLSYAGGDGNDVEVEYVYTPQGTLFQIW